MGEIAEPVEHGLLPARALRAVLQPPQPAVCVRCGAGTMTPEAAGRRSAAHPNGDRRITLSGRDGHRAPNPADGSDLETPADDRRSALAVITTPGQRLALGVDDEVTFGRADHVDLPIGRDPFDDALIAGVTGALCAWRGRVVVCNRSPKLAFDIAVPGRAMVSLAPSASYVPADPEFTVIVRGAVRHELRVSAADKQSRRGPSAPPAGPTTPVVDAAGSRHRTTTQFLADRCADGDLTSTDTSRPGLLVLTDRQRAVLDAYVAPMAHGLLPATHKQVAEVIGVCRQTIRLECASIWHAFLTAGVPMHDLRDTRDAIAHAWAMHRL